MTSTTHPAEHINISTVVTWKPLALVTYAWAHLTMYEDCEDEFSDSIENMGDILS